ncbi:MAG: Tellurite resistance protein TerB, partial [Allorhizobium sp.]
MNKPVSPEEALIFVMVMASAVDNAMAEKELVRIGQLIDILPVFDNFEK